MRGTVSKEQDLYLCVTNGSGCASGRPKNIRILRIPNTYTLHKAFSSKFSTTFAGKSAETVKRGMRTWRERPGEGWVGGAGPCHRVRGRPGIAPPSPPLGSRQTAAAACGRALLSPCLKGQFHEMNIFYEVS
jgi:hypothetical protein